MDINTWLQNTQKKLSTSGVSTARLDCLILLEDATGKDRAWLLAHPEFTVQGSTLYMLQEQIERRTKHEPQAYIRGKSEFYGREFIVTKHTLEPRPETEAMIDLVKSIVKTRENLTIADIGTGSGCIAVSVKLALPYAQVVATDIDVKSLEIARENSSKYDADIDFFHGNLLEPLSLEPNILLCNLPYVPDNYELNKAARYEPKHAIFGGADGLELYRQMFAQINANHIRPKWISTESLPFQHQELTKIAERSGYRLDKSEDFIQAFRL